MQFEVRYRERENLISFKLVSSINSTFHSKKEREKRADNILGKKCQNKYLCYQKNVFINKSIKKFIFILYNRN